MTPPPALPTPRPHRLRDAVLLVALAAAAALLRFAVARHSALEAGEIYIVLLARHSFGGMMALVAQDVEQPLYFALTWAWRALGGDGALWVRTLPVLAGVAGVCATVLLARRMVGVRAGWFAGALLAVQQIHIESSATAVPSTVLWFFLTLALLAGWIWLERPRPWPGVLFVLSGAAAVYTYYFAMFPLAVLAIHGVIRLRSSPRALWAWLGLFLGIALLFGPQMPTWFGQLGADVRGDLNVPPMPASQLVTLAHRLTHRSGVIAAVLFALGLAALWRPQHRRATGLLWGLIVAPAIVPFALSQAGLHLFFYGQMLFALPLMAILVAAGIDTLPGEVLPLLAGGALLLAAGRTAVREARAQDQDPELAAVDQLRRDARPGDLVVCAEPHSQLFFEYYLPGALRYRLVQMPGVEAFHYSDAVLAIPDSARLSRAAWQSEIDRGARWWGLRFTHFPIYRTGTEAAAAMDSLARGPVRRFGKATLWQGFAASPAPAPPAGSP